VGNAIRYTEPEGKISTEAHARDGEVLISIRDSGIGIPEEDLPRIYDPSTAARTPGGSRASGLA
jgi:signal transduction histidine kinase